MDADRVQDVDHRGHGYEFLHLEESLERAKAFLETFVKFGDQFSSPDDVFFMFLLRKRFF